MTSSSKALFKAIKEDDIYTFKSLIEAHTYVEYRDPQEFTLLHRAAQMRRPDFAEILLMKGADVMSRCRWKNTPLHEAAVNGNVQTAKVLIRYGAKIDSFSDWAETPLIRALDRRLLAMVSFLLEYKANALEKNHEGKSALNMLATDTRRKNTKNDHIFMLKFIEKGARLETPFQGLTPLQHSVNNNKFKLANILLYKGANPNVFDHCGLTPLHRAVLINNYDLMYDLLENHADVNALTKGENSWTPLHCAVKHSDKNMCNYLLKYGADWDLKNSHGYSPLDLDRDKKLLTRAP